MLLLKNTLALKLIPKIGDITARKLIDNFGSASEVFSMSKNELLAHPGISKSLASNISLNAKKALETAETELEFCKENNITPIPFYDKKYPHRLLQCPDAPLILFWKGNCLPDHQKTISIVGTRKSNEYGSQMVNKIISGFEKDEAMIISGLAYGIDTYAHSYALDNNLPTVAVLGHGFKTLYPAINRKLAERILINGALVTEFLSSTSPDRENFPARNRIIAGLSDTTIVIQARARGGALITAEMALSYNRDVFSVPGRIDDERSHGCHWLIKTNRAGLIETTEDLRAAMGWTKEKKTSKQTTINSLLNPVSESILNLIQNQVICSIDFICNALELQLNAVAMALLELEFEGLIQALPGKRYRIS